MDIKINKDKIKNFFSYYGWLVLVAIIVSFAGWYYVINTINEYAPNELIKFFIEAYQIKDDKIFNDLSDYLKEDGVQKIDVHTYSPDSKQIGDYYTAFGKSSDIIILHSKDLLDMSEAVSEDFISINAEFEAEMMENVNEIYDFYTFENNKYAIKIYSADDDEYNQRFTYQNWINFNAEEKEKYDYYMLFSKNSLNFGEYNEAYLSKNAIKAVNYILKESINEAK